MAVIEFTHDFVMVCDRVVADHLEPRPEDVRFRLGLRGGVYRDRDGNEHRLYLSPGPIQDFAFDEYSRKTAPDATFATSVGVRVATEEPHLDAGKIAFELVRRLYNWFGHTDDAIPCTNPAGDAIDIEQIRTLG